MLPFKDFLREKVTRREFTPVAFSKKKGMWHFTVKLPSEDFAAERHDRIRLALDSVGAKHSLERNVLNVWIRAKNEADASAKVARIKKRMNNE